MRHNFKSFVFAVSAAALILTSFDALAQQKPAPAAGNPAATSNASKGAIRAASVAVLDVGQVLRDAKAMRSAREQLSALGKKYQAELEKKASDLRAANEDLRRKRSILSPEAYETERQKFDQMRAAGEQLRQKRNLQLDRANKNALEEVRRIFNQIVAEMASERSYGMIFSKGATVFAHPAIEITPEVLARLDKRLPSVKVSVPK